MSLHNKALICFRCLNFVAWSVEENNELLCDKCRKKEMEQELLKSYTKGVIKK